MGVSWTWYRICLRVSELSSKYVLCAANLSSMLIFSRWVIPSRRSVFASGMSLVKKSLLLTNALGMCLVGLGARLVSALLANKVSGKIVTESLIFTPLFKSSLRERRSAIVLDFPGMCSSSKS